MRFRGHNFTLLKAGVPTFNTSKVRFRGARRPARGGASSAAFNTSKVRFRAPMIRAPTSAPIPFNTSKVRFRDGVAQLVALLPRGFQYLKGAIQSRSARPGEGAAHALSIPQRCDSERPGTIRPPCFRSLSIPQRCDSEDAVVLGPAALVILSIPQRCDSEPSHLGCAA